MCAIVNNGQGSIVLRNGRQIKRHSAPDARLRLVQSAKALALARVDEGGPLDGNYDVGAELSYYLSIRGKTTQMQFILSLFNIEINLIGGICICVKRILPSLTRF